MADWDALGRGTGGNALSVGARWVFWAAVALFVALLALNSLVYEGTFSPDSVFYVDAAQNLVAGRGLANSMAELNRLLDTGEVLPKPMTVWGPLFPVAVAALSLAGPSAPAAALVLPAVFLFLTLAGVYLLVARLYGPISGFVAVAFLLHFAPLLAVANHGWSETMGLAFAFSSLYLMLPARETEGKRGWAWSLAGGLAAGLAVGTRYAFAPLVLVGALSLANRSSRRESASKIAVFLLGALLVVGPVLGRNLYLTGHAGGARWGASEAGFAEGALALASVLWNTTYVESLAGRSALALLCAVLLTVGIFAAARGTLRPGAVMKAALGGRKSVLLVWSLLYLGFLLVSQTRVRVDALDARLVLPSTMAIYLMAVAAAVKLLGPRPLAISALSFALVAAALHGEGRTTRMLWGSSLPGAYDFEAKRDRSECLTWLADHVSTGDLVVAEDGMDLPLYLGPVDTVFFSEAMTPGLSITYEKMSRCLLEGDRCRAYGKVYLLVRRRTGFFRVLSADPAPFVSDLLEGREGQYPGIRLNGRFEDGLVFDVECEDLVRQDSLSLDAVPR